MKKLPDGAAIQKYQKEILKQQFFHYWHAPRGARGVKKSGRLNWRLLWWVGVLKFITNWIKFECATSRTATVSCPWLDKGLLMQHWVFRLIQDKQQALKKTPQYFAMRTLVLSIEMPLMIHWWLFTLSLFYVDKVYNIKL